MKTRKIPKKIESLPESEVPAIWSVLIIKTFFELVPTGVAQFMDYRTGQWIPLWPGDLEAKDWDEEMMLPGVRLVREDGVVARESDVADWIEAGICGVSDPPPEEPTIWKRPEPTDGPEYHQDLAHWLAHHPKRTELVASEIWNDSNDISDQARTILWYSRQDGCQVQRFRRGQWVDYEPITGASLRRELAQNVPFRILLP